MSYYIAKKTPLGFDEAVAAAIERLKEQGFGVLTDIDVKATLKQKIGADFRRYRILGACNPHLAHKALQTEDKIGVLLPCSVIVQELEDGGSEVAAIDPLVAMATVGNKDLEELGKEARDRLVRAVESV
jgi:uncharacterized protein (DUF302 family)